jgi:hypothetical protein
MPYFGKEEPYAKAIVNNHKKRGVVKREKMSEVII